MCSSRTFGHTMQSGVAFRARCLTHRSKLVYWLSARRELRAGGCPGGVGARWPGWVRVRAAQYRAPASAAHADMTILVPMSRESFERFRCESIANYARNNVRALRWSDKIASGRSEFEFDKLLPDGLTTPHHYLYEIKDDLDSTTAGYLWFMYKPSPYERTAYLFNIRVLPEFRGFGHASQAMKIFEEAALKMGAVTVGLHIFEFNTTGQALYRSLGYGITGFQMIKRLQPDPG